MQHGAYITCRQHAARQHAGKDLTQHGDNIGLGNMGLGLGFRV